MGWKGALGLAARLKLVDGLGLRSLSLSFEGCSIDLTAWKAVAASIPEHGLEKLRLSFRRSGVTEAEAEELAELIRGRFPHMQSRRAIALAACVRAVVRSLLSQKCSAGHTFHTHPVYLQLTYMQQCFKPFSFFRISETRSLFSALSQVAGVAGAPRSAFLTFHQFQ